MSLKKDPTNKNDIRTPFKLVGIHHFKDGRTCKDHDACGKQLQINDIIRIRSVVVEKGKYILF